MAGRTGATGCRLGVLCHVHPPRAAAPDGAYPQATPLLQARSSEILRKKPGHTQYQLGTVFTAPDGNLQVCTTSVQGSDQISSLARANGLIVLRHEQGDVTAGDVVEILMFDTTL